MVSLPYPNQHSARIHAPGGYDSFATKKLTDGVTAILGIKNGKSEIQAYRFDKTKFTPAQAKKWLKDNKVKSISFEPAKEMSKGALESESKIIKRESGKIYVAGVLQRTGVFNGGLKPWDEWKDSIPLMTNTLIIRGEHPEDPISGDFVPIDNQAEIIGRIAEAMADEKNKLARGIYELEEDKLTQDEIKELEAGKPIGTSPGYWCNKDVLSAPRLWEDGTPYTFIERKFEGKSFLYDHFATPQRPACHDCGMLINSETGDEIIGKKRTPEEIKEAVAQLKDEGGGEPAFLVNQAIDEVALQNEIFDILECTDDFQKGRDALSLLVQLLRTILAVPVQSLAAMSLKHKIPIPEEGMVEKDKEGQKVIPDEKIKLMVNAAVEEAIKPISDALGKAETTIAEQAKTITEQTTKLTQIETAEKDRLKKETEAAVIASTAAEEGRKKSFLDKLKPGIAKTAEEIEKIWTEAKTDLWAWTLSNPDKMAFAANSMQQPPHVLGNPYVPKGATISPGITVNADNKDEWYRGQGITPASELAKQIYGGK